MEVRRVVVSFVSVYMMNDLAGAKFSSKHLFSYYSMFVSAVDFRIGLIRTGNRTEMTLPDVFTHLIRHTNRIKLSVHFPHILRAKLSSMCIATKNMIVYHTFISHELLTTKLTSNFNLFSRLHIDFV